MKNKKGITLIALIITIIVLLILAGVSISLVMGDNGIATKAQKAKKDTTIEQAKEQMRLAIAAATTDGEGKVFYDNLVTELDNQFGESGYSISGDEDSEEWEISVTTTEGVVTETVQATKVDMIAEIREYFQSLMDTNSEPYLSTYITLSSGIIVENMGYDFEEHVFFLLDRKDIYKVEINEDEDTHNYTISVNKTDIDVDSIGTKGDTVTSITRITDPNLVVVPDYTTADSFEENSSYWSGITYKIEKEDQSIYCYNKWGILTGIFLKFIPAVGYSR